MRVQQPMRNARFVEAPFLVLALLLLFSAIGVADEVAAQRPTVPLSCDPKKLTSADTLILRFRMPHPAELAIRAPGNIWYFVVFEPDKSTPPPIVDKASFAKMPEIRLPVKTARGIRWETDPKNEVIFQQSGTYEVVLTDTLESEVPSFRCEVTFDGKR